MRVFLILFRKELRSYLLNPLGWIVAAFIVIMHGICIATAIEFFQDSARVTSLVQEAFRVPFFWFYFLFIFPLITMRLFADEQRSGTMETLLTAPVRSSQVVLSKYVAALVFYTLLWLPTILQFYLIPWVSGNPAPWTLGILLSSYLCILLMGCYFIAIGLLCSALTANSIVAAIFTIALLTLHYFLGYITTIYGESFAGKDFFHYISAQDHLLNSTKGLFSTTTPIYYLSMTAFTLLLTYHILDFRRWRK